MTWEEEVFRNRIIIPKKLEEFGFAEKDGIYCFEIPASNHMVLRLFCREGIISGGIFDPDTGEEFMPARMPVVRGEYTAVLKEEYLNLLSRAAASCSIPSPLSSVRAERLAARIIAEYSCIPQRKKNRLLFSAENGGAVFAVIERCGRGKQTYDRILFRAEEVSAGSIIRRDETENMYFIVIDEAMPDEEYLPYISESLKISQAVSARRKWLVPANPKYYDIDHAFTVRDTLYWRQNAGISAGDLVFIYYGMPFGEIRYECVALETDIPAKPDPEGRFLFRKLMRIRKIRMLEGGRISRAVMKKFGVVSVRSARYMPEDLYQEIIRCYGGEDE